MFVRPGGIRPESARRSKARAPWRFPPQSLPVRAGTPRTPAVPHFFRGEVVLVVAPDHFARPPAAIPRRFAKCSKSVVPAPTRRAATGIQPVGDRALARFLDESEPPLHAGSAIRP